jgi:hypothetical protein
MIANCNALGLQYLLWWVQGCLFWPLQSLRKLASLMVLHLGAGSLFSISRSRFRIACTLGILSRLLAWSAFSASQTKFWWPFRFFCLAIMLLCTLSQISFIAVFTAFECDIGSWASSASTEKPSLPRNNPFGHSGESWALPPVENLQLFVLFIEENDDPRADSHMARVNPTATTSAHQRGIDGGWTEETLFPLRSSSLFNLIWTQLRVHRQTPTEWCEAFDGWCAAGGCWLSLTLAIFGNSTCNNHEKTLNPKPILNMRNNFYITWQNHIIGTKAKGWAKSGYKPEITCKSFYMSGDIRMKTKIYESGNLDIYLWKINIPPFYKISSFSNIWFLIFNFNFFWRNL